MQQQPLTILELIFSLNALHRLWLFRCIFYRLHRNLPLYRVQFPSHFSEVYFLNMFLILFCFHQSGLRDVPMQSDLERVASAHSFYSIAQCSVDMIHLQQLQCPDFSMEARGYHAAVKQAQHLPNASAVLAGAHIWVTSGLTWVSSLWKPEHWDGETGEREEGRGGTWGASL